VTEVGKKKTKAATSTNTFEPMKGSNRTPLFFIPMPAPSLAASLLRLL
jgi:hypothetical protein